MMPTWTQLSAEQQCVVYAACTAGLLQDLLCDWEPGLNWPARLTHVPRLAQAITELHRAGLIEVYQTPDPATDSALLTADDLAAVVDDPANWMTEDAPASLVELGLTDDATTVLATSTPSTAFAFGNR
jgi:hypothetical protein